MRENAYENLVDINPIHWALTLGYEVASGLKGDPSSAVFERFTRRDFMHFNEGKRQALVEVAIHG